ncbi:MAG TPA: 6-phosphogluconolactonase [Smithella sp.]|jgi:glucosamine-6-phosphate deaminase|nr:MAG: Glucosamine-6-phosphate deaminase [Deltaproteobacteria bacterium ADurb.Bin022]HOG09651.1 6-phosphogluconolactonase [Smithella sp.]HOS13766.1 6-phosphogluconolactonase [Smithella sp.]HOX98330.1 6-phosphogluconolactonase [Smithella sp.]HPH54292.1 6-phosphogluconolactonase [Smithella sp.]
MGTTIWVTKDFAHMSDVASGIVIKKSIELLKRKKEIALGLATGNSPTGLYKHLAKAVNEGRLDAGRIRSFNLDEYVGLPGNNIQQRVMHPESYAYFMIQELFGHLNKKFIETRVPYGSLIDQKMLIRELKDNKSDWEFKGTDAGKSIAIKAKAQSPYLAWIRKDILDGYVRKIKAAGGIDLQIIGVGGRGHVAFHESGIPFQGSSMLLVKLDDNTIANAVADGHFKTKADSPQYAISMGAELVYKAKTVVLVANGARKTESVTRSILGNMTPEIPISYGQAYSQKGGELIYVLDRIAAQGLLENTSALKTRGVILKNLA